MVAEASNQTSDYVYREMPYARGLQFRTVWYGEHEIPCSRPLAQASPLARVI